MVIDINTISAIKISFVKYIKFVMWKSFLALY